MRQKRRDAFDNRIHRRRNRRVIVAPGVFQASPRHVAPPRSTEIINFNLGMPGWNGQKLLACREL